MIYTISQGFLIELSLVMTVGMQSAFILKQGLRKEFVLAAVLACLLGESILVTIGIAGMGVLLNSIPSLQNIVTGIGIAFLIFYAIISIKDAIKNEDYIDLNNEDNKHLKSFKTVFLSGLAFALLNPHTIIDTTIMGSLAGRFHPNHWYFAIGVYLAALTWYAFLGILGSVLAKPLNKRNVWRAINILIAIICLFMAANFAKSILHPEIHNHEHEILGIETEHEHRNEHEHNNEIINNREDIEHNEVHNHNH